MHNIILLHNGDSLSAFFRVLIETVVLGYPIHKIKAQSSDASCMLDSCSLMSFSCKNYNCTTLLNKRLFLLEKICCIDKLECCIAACKVLSEHIQSSLIVGGLEHLDRWVAKDGLGAIGRLFIGMENRCDIKLEDIFYFF